jgi:hypothetical protein
VSSKDPALVNCTFWSSKADRDMYQSAFAREYEERERDRERERERERDWVEK